MLRVRREHLQDLCLLCFLALFFGFGLNLFIIRGAVSAGNRAGAQAQAIPQLWTLGKVGGAALAVLVLGWATGLIKPVARSRAQRRRERLLGFILIAAGLCTLYMLWAAVALVALALSNPAALSSHERRRELCRKAHIELPANPKLFAALLLLALMSMPAFLEAALLALALALTYFSLRTGGMGGHRYPFMYLWADEAFSGPGMALFGHELGRFFFHGFCFTGVELIFAASLASFAAFAALLLLNPGPAAA